MANWTDEQYDAIYTSGHDVLVAAAAGSGKTAVLVERIIQKVTNQDKPIDIDTLLVVTFTNAAAQEMRNRVGLALEQTLAENPSSNHLKKQLSLLQRASISTLHSFCLDVMRQYAYLLDIDPGFRIAGDMEADLIQQEVIADLFEEWYGKEGDEQQRFFEVVDRFSSDRSDEDVENLVLKLYTFAMQNPWPDAWLDSLYKTYDVPDNWSERDLPWLSIIKREASDQFEAIREEMERALDLTRESDGPYHYADAIDDDLRQLNEALVYLDKWEDLQAYMQTSAFTKLSGKRIECNEDKKNKVKSLRDSYKKRWNDMKQSWFTRDLASHVEDMKELAPVIRKLTELVKEFKRRFTKQKQEKAIVDFSDLEHYCLELLLDESSSPEQQVPSRISEHFKAQFTEVLVDEYQDTNLVQETILRLISDQSGAGNMFMVGDVKQSIYRFRHAEPSLFIDKYKRYAGSDSLAKRIDLASNFRSREQVLAGINYLFRQIIDEKVGEITYDQDAELIYANHMYDDYAFPESEPELIVIDREADDEEGSGESEAENYQDLEKAQLEARAYAEKIKRWIGQKDQDPLQVVDKATQIQRDVQYRDMVILLRSMTWAPTIADELKKQGIPIYAELSTGYFEAIEVKIMISLLKVIDNSRQDIPLASVLRSPIVGLNEEELAQIRLADRKGSYYDALLQFNRRETGELADKVMVFLDQLERFRIVARQGALSELIWQIYQETGYYDFVGGMPGGRQRQANLRALYDRARGYESTSFRGLFRFLRFIERMEERGDDLGAARALSEQEDVVRMMTIHSSKGLEFPVVIVGAMDKQFNLMDLNQRYLLHKDLGFASQFIDPVKRITYPTLLYHAFKREKLREQLAEEMRVLYVALTRAKEKLVMVANVPSFTKKQEKWEKMLDHTDWVLPAHDRMDSKSYLDWVGPALIRHHMNDVLRDDNVSNTVLEAIWEDASKWDISIVHGSDYANLDEAEEEVDKQLRESITRWQPLELSDETLKEKVDQRLSFKYPFQQAQTARAKQTVTEIKRQREVKDEYTDEQLVQTFHAPIVKRPKFMQQERTISAAERGTAMHTVMQHIPLKRVPDKPEIEEFVEELVEREILTKEEAAVIDTEAIYKFFTTDIGKSLITATEVYREVPFSLSLPASQVYPTWENDTDERVLVQGVIDCVLPSDDGWIIVDYKTDRIDKEVTDEVIKQLGERYKVQINLYQEALKKIWNQPIGDAYLYFFDEKLLVNPPQTENRM